MRKMDTRCRLTACCSVLVRRYTVMVVLVPLLVLLYWVHSVEHSWSLRLLATLPSHLSRAAPAQSRDNLNKEDIGQFLVDTPSCRIPNADAFDAALRPFINPPEPLDCRNGPPPLTYSDLDSVHLITERLHLYGDSPPEVIISCCTHDISWFNSSVGVPPDLVSSGEQNIYLSAQCRPLTDRYTPETAGGVEVLCSKNGTLVYRNYHQFVPLLPDLEAVSRQRPAHAVMPSVLIFMFDSLSRLQFHRWFPRSRRLLYDEMDAFELGGLNKHGDNTWPNMLQMLTGMGQAELEALCAPNPRTDPLDNCPFIWREFKRAGYRTAMAEDCPDIGMFDYMKAGFIHQPTDYYNRPTALMAFRYIAHNVVLNTHLCDGTRPSYESTFTFAEHLATRLADRPYWGYVVQNAFSHDYFNMPYHLDEPFYRLLKQLLSTGALENTVLVTMGDHGLRWGAERETFVGGLEERLPLVSLYFPPWLRRRYPVAFSNLRTNQRRLTTFRDLHRTMLDLLTPEVSLGSVGTDPAPANESAVSLFRPISVDRHCDHVFVPQHYCTCLESQQISAKDEAALHAAHTVVRTVNAELREAPQCAQLELAQVLSARISWPPNADLANGVNALEQLVTVQIETRPGDARFEATVLGNRSELVLGGAVSRLNSYGQLRRCVADHRLEKFCYCRDDTAAASATAAAGGTRPSATGTP